MKHYDGLVGTGATFMVTLAGAEDFGLKLLSSVAVAVLSTIAVYFVRRWLERFAKNNPIPVLPRAPPPAQEPAPAAAPAAPPAPVSNEPKP
jgi:hypothetical protein